MCDGCGNKEDIAEIKLDINSIPLNTTAEDEVEQWVDICGYEGLYRISNKGRVLKLHRIFSHGKNHSTITHSPAKILSTSNNSHRYNSVGLTKNGICTRKYVHRLVADAFIPNPENKKCVGHKDDNPHNNNVNNLFWCTQDENLKDMVLKGRSRKGEKVHNSKLTTEAVCDIKRMLNEANAHIPTIASLFGVSRATIHRVRKGVCWKEVTHE